MPDQRVCPSRSLAKACGLKVLQLLWLWAGRHTQRNDLSEMGDHRLSDLGRHRAEVRREWSGRSDPANHHRRHSGGPLLSAKIRKRIDCRRIHNPLVLYSSIPASPSPQPQPPRFSRRITIFPRRNLYLRAAALRC
ncbi:MAG: DUF1127 domain-containing protein [Aurantimonas endophytica]|uniref:DUF1127 domain-containing protein n=1 Tax=Aurantimonas endophytica TaxID=1522175 RepID=UPI0030016232